MFDNVWAILVPWNKDIKYLKIFKPVWNIYYDPYLRSNEFSL